MIKFIRHDMCWIWLEYLFLVVLLNFVTLQKNILWTSKEKIEDAGYWYNISW